MVKKIILVAIFTIGCFMSGFLFAEVAMGATQEEMEDYAERTAMLFDLSPELVKAVIQQESDWNARDVSCFMGRTGDCSTVRRNGNSICTRKIKNQDALANILVWESR